MKIPQTRIQASHNGQKGVGAYLSMKTKLCISSKPQDSTSNFAVAKTTPINNAVDELIFFLLLDFISEFAKLRKMFVIYTQCSNTKLLDFLHMKFLSKAF